MRSIGEELISLYLIQLSGGLTPIKQARKEDSLSINIPPSLHIILFSQFPIGQTT